MQAPEIILTTVSIPNSFVVAAIEPETHQVHIVAEWEVDEALAAIQDNYNSHYVERILLQRAAQAVANMVARVGTPLLVFNVKLCEA
jgi:hypothetical protein